MALASIDKILSSPPSWRPTEQARASSVRRAATGHTYSDSIELVAALQRSIRAQVATDVPGAKTAMDLSAMAALGDRS